MEKVNLNPKYISFVSILLFFIDDKKFNKQKKLLTPIIYSLSSGIKLLSEFPYISLLRAKYSYSIFDWRKSSLFL